MQNTLPKTRPNYRRPMGWLFLLTILLTGLLSPAARAQAYDPNGTTVAGGNGQGSAPSQLNSPNGVYVDASGNVYVSDLINNRVQKWAPGAASGTTVAGGNGQGSGTSQLYFPRGIHVDASGNLYIADSNNDRVQKWAPGATSGTTVAGGNGRGGRADQLAFPAGVSVDASGNVYVADYNNNRVQRWAPGATSGTTVAGGNGSGNLPSQASNPLGVYVDASGNVYVAAQTSHSVQKWARGATMGTTVAGGNGSGSGASQLSEPTDVYVDASGNVYVADWNNHRIQKWAPGATAGTTVAGGNGFGSAANQLKSIFGVHVDASSNVYVADGGNFGNNRVQKFSLLVAPTVSGLSATPNPICAGQSITFTATVGKNSGNYSYTLNNGAGSSLSGTASGTAFSQSVTAIGSGSQTYTLTLTNDKGTASTGVMVTVNPLPTPAITGLSAAYCKDAPAVTLTGTPAGGSFTIDGNASSQLDPASLSVGDHTVRYTLTENGCTAFAEQSVEIKPVPNASFTGLTGPYCADAAAVTLTPTSSGGSFSGPGISGSTFTPANAGVGGSIMYTLTVGGCTNSSSQNVTVNPVPTVNAGPDQSVILGFGGANSNCTDLTATPSGGSGGDYTFTWNPGNLNGQTVNVCPEQTTTYTVTVKDGNMCTSVPDEVIVNVQDVRCGNRQQNVTICYYGVTQCVSEKIAKRYLKLGATLGGCGTNARMGVPESEVPLQLSLKAYPNPVQDAVTVEILSRVAGSATFEILDVTGRVRQSRQQELVEGLNEVEFRLGTFPTGIYLIKAVDALGQHGVVRVSRQ